MKIKFSRIMSLLLASSLMGAILPVLAGITYHAITTYDEERDSHREDERRIDKRMGKTEGQDTGLFRIEVDAWVDGDKAKITIIESDDGAVPEGGSLITLDAGDSFVYLNPRNQSYAEWSFDKATGKLGKLSKKMNSLFKKKVGEVSIEQISKKAGGKIGGYDTTHYTYRSSYESTTKLFGKKISSLTTIEDQFWMTEKLKAAGMLAWLKRRKASSGDETSNASIDTTLGKIPGVPLRIRSALRFSEKTGEESVYYSTLDVSDIKQEAIDPAVFEIPKDYKKTSLVKAIIKP